MDDDDFNEFIDVVEENVVERIPKRYIRDAENPFDFYTEHHFKRRYRFSKETVRDVLLPLIYNQLTNNTNRGLPPAPIEQLFVALRFYATGEFQVVGGDLRGVSQPSVSRIIKKVSELFAMHLRNYVKYPQNHHVNIRQFFEFAQFPGVSACIDGTHIPVKNPGRDIGEVFRNRKSIFSLNVQVACGPNMKILDIVVRYPGSMHDNVIFQRCSLRIKYETNEIPEVTAEKTEKRPVSVTIPTAVKRLDTVTLQCNYNLSGEPIYTVKWYKGPKEFYRYIPKELPNVQVFALPGITVDEQKSTHKNLVLKNVQPEVTGRYKCEVSSDAPNFYTYMQSGYMYVIDVPVDDPILRLDKEILDTGYRLKGNCSSPPSWPPANITWLLNGKRINGTYQQRVQPHDYNMKVTTYTNKRVPLVTISGIELAIDENNFHAGKARISCVANVFHLYRREKNIVLDEDRPRPRPSSVLGTRDASAGEAAVVFRNIHSIFSTIFISILVISR